MHYFQGSRSTDPLGPPYWSSSQLGIIDLPENAIQIPFLWRADSGLILYADWFVYLLELLKGEPIKLIHQEKRIWLQNQNVFASVKRVSKHRMILRSTGTRK